MNRRKKRRRHTGHSRKKQTNSVISVLLVIFMSVAAGYITATQILAPALGLETEKTFMDVIKEKKEDSKAEETQKKDSIGTENKVVEDTLNVEQQGFALQYGSFSSRSGAQELVQELKTDGIDTQIIEKEGSYKVIGQLFETKEAASEHKESTAGTEEVFITQIP